MHILTFSEIARWKVGKMLMPDIEAWCKIHCSGKVTLIRLKNTHSGFAFENADDVLIFTLAWR